MSMLEKVAEALYDYWRTYEDFANDYCEWALLGDKQTWLDRAKAALQALREIAHTIEPDGAAELFIEAVLDDTDDMEKK